MTRRAYERLAELDPPDEVRADARRYVDVARRKIVVLERVTRAPSERDAQRIVRGSDIERLEERGADLAGEIGFDDCR